jgi:CSLREA domain-containing protein
MQWASFLRRLLILLILAPVAGFTLGGPTAITHAAGKTFSVNSTMDTPDATPGDGLCETASGNGVCTLRAAIQETNALAGADAIKLQSGATYVLTRAGDDDIALNGDLDITDDVTIEGAGSATTSINGGGLDRVFQIQNSKTVTFNNLTIRGGSATTGGGIYNGGTLTLNDSTVRDNQARTNSSGGGIANFSGALTINSSAIVSNSAPNFGGGLFNTAGGVVTISNSTFSGNSVGADGGAIYSYAMVSLNYVTVANNTAQTAGGIQQGSGGTIKLKNSLVATNHGVATDCGGSLTSQGHNLIGNTDGCTVTGAAGDQIGAGASPIDPHVGPLQDNGGGAFTHALLFDSPAIDAGSLASCASTDQRGITRPQGTGCDIGAYEFDGPVKQNQTITFAALPNRMLGDPPFPLSATASSGLAVTFKASGKCSLSGASVTLSGQAGSCTIVASQAGNAAYNAAPDVSRSFAINSPAKQNQTIIFNPLPNRTVGDAPFPLSAMASSGLAVTFTASGKCAVSGSSVTLSGQLGNCTIVASQAGDASYNAAPNVSRSFTINSPAKQNQAISFAALPNRTLGDPPFSLSAAASSGLLVGFSTSTPAACTVSGTTVALLSTGTCTIIASQDGDGSFNAATDVTQSFLIANNAPPLPNAIVYLPITVR